MFKVDLEFVFIPSGKTHRPGNEGLQGGSSYSQISRNRSHDTWGHVGMDQSQEAERQWKSLGKAFVAPCTAKKGTKQDRKTQDWRV